MIRALISCRALGLCVSLALASAVLTQPVSAALRGVPALGRRLQGDPPLSTVDWNAPVEPTGLHFDTLDAHHAHDAPLDVQLRSPEPEFHWVIVSCIRPHLAKVLTSTLASAWLSGMKPSTITIVWCKRYKDGDIPPVLYNLRHSKLVKVVFLPDNLYINPVKPTKLLHPLLIESRGKDNPTGVYLTALSVPHFYKKTDIPLLITEDDVYFAPDFNLRLASVIGQALHTAGDKPYLVQLYNMGTPSPLSEVVAELHTANFNDAQQSIVVGIHSLGNQALLYSPDMARFMANHFSKVAPDYPEGATDILVFEGLTSKPFYCATTPEEVKTQQCVVFRAIPSLIQHAGIASSIFTAGGENKKFHVAWDFPINLSLVNKATLHRHPDTAV